jgi:hypothetical protein
MDVIDGSCVRRIVDISAAEYARMPKDMLKGALYTLRAETGGYRHHTYAMKKPALLEEIMQRLGQLPPTCDIKIDVGKRFDPNSKPVTFLLVSDYVEAIRTWPLPDLAIDLIVANFKRNSTSLVMVHGDVYTRQVQPRFARPLRMTKSGVCTLQELEAVPVGPDEIYPSRARWNAFTPGDPLEKTLAVRYIPGTLGQSGSWYETPAVRYVHGSQGIWHVWNGAPVNAHFYR